MTKNYIPLHEPKFNGNEVKYLKECIRSSWVSTNGLFIKKFEKHIEKYTKSKYAIFCINGTHALQISLLVAGVKSGDEVIVPTITFIAPINAISYNHAKPIFMDCDEYYNIDEEKTIEFINKETIYKNGFTINKKTKKIIRAIIVVHTFGNAVNLNQLVPLCKKRNIKIIEDASEALGTHYIKNEKYAGTVGDFGVISFNGNKIITSGAGGMILVKNKKNYDRIKYLIYQAKNDALNFIHNEIGYNFAQTNLNAALGLAQLENIEKIISAKEKIHDTYKKNLNLTPNLKLVNVPEYSKNNYWLNILKVNRKYKKKLLHFLNKERILARPVWQLNHLQVKYKNCQTYNIQKAVYLHKTSICLPSSYHLRKEDLFRVIKTLTNFKF